MYSQFMMHGQKNIKFDVTCILSFLTCMLHASTFFFFIVS